jgi:hypothetical protein
MSNLAIIILSILSFILEGQAATKLALKSFYPSKKGEESLQKVQPKKAAGIFIYGLQNGVPYALLLKRKTSSEWVTPGGLLEIGESYVKGSLREFSEETADFLDIKPTDLIKKNKHENLMISEKTLPGTIKLHPEGIIYNLFFSKIDSLKTTQNFMENNPSENEISEMRWVAIPDLIRLIKFGESSGDVRMLSHDGKAIQIRGIALYGPFLELMKKNMSVFEEISKENSTWEKASEEKKISSETPQEIENWKHQLVERAKLSSALKKHFETQQAKKDKTELSSLKKILLQAPYTASQAYLNILLGKKYDENNDADNILSFLKNLNDPWYANYEENTLGHEIKEFDKEVLSHLSKNQRIINILNDCLKNELAHKDKIAVYHGANAESGFILEVLTEFRRFLTTKNMDQSIVFRGIDTAFREMATIHDFIEKMDALRESGLSVAYNYLPGYQERGLSVNLFPMGNYPNKGSSSLAYFALNYSEAPPGFKILKDFFKDINLPDYTEEFSILFKRYLKDDSYFFQILIDADKMDDLLYISELAGEKLKLNMPRVEVDNNNIKLDENNLVKETIKPSQIIPILRLDPPYFEKLLRSQHNAFKLRATYSPIKQGSKMNVKSFFTPENKRLVYANYIEGRLFLKPDLLLSSKWTVTKTYHRLPDNQVKEYKKRLSLLVQNIIKDNAEAFLRLNKEKFYQEPKLSKLAKISGGEYSEKLSQPRVIDYVLEGNIPELEKAMSVKKFDPSINLKLEEPQLIDQFGSSSVSPLKIALKMKNIPLMKFLLENGSHISDDIYGQSLIDVVKLGDEKLGDLYIEKHKSFLSQYKMPENVFEKICFVNIPLAIKFIKESGIKLDKISFTNATLDRILRIYTQNFAQLMTNEEFEKNIRVLFSFISKENKKFLTGEDFRYDFHFIFEKLGGYSKKVENKKENQKIQIILSILQEILPNDKK